MATIDRTKALTLGHLSDLTDKINAKFAKKATTLAGYGITDAYTSSETDTKIAAAVAAADHMKRKIVDSTDAIDLTASDASQYIYMVKKGTAKDSDKYDEYLVLDGVLEKVGDWEVDLTGYVQKEDGKSLMLDTDKTKLDGIAEGATKVEASTQNGYIKIDGTETQVYKAEDIAEATTEAAGLMSASDKTKLNGVSTGANKVEASTTNGNIVIDGAETAVVTFATDAEVTAMLAEKFGD